MQALMESIAPLRQYGAKLGPYVLVELLLPGGTLFALLLFVYQRRLKGSAGNSVMPSALPTVVASANHVAGLQYNRFTDAVRRWCAA